jgi:hypothetical protein
LLPWQPNSFISHIIENFMILAWYEMHLKWFIFAYIATIHII